MFLLTWICTDVYDTYTQFQGFTGFNLTVRLKDWKKLVFLNSECLKIKHTTNVSDQIHFFKGFTFHCNRRVLYTLYRRKSCKLFLYIVYYLPRSIQLQNAIQSYSVSMSNIVSSQKRSLLVGIAHAGFG